jgi:excisionase family DNA binding protein
MHTEYAHIGIEAGHLGGKPHIEGRRLTVQDIVEHYVHFDWTADQISRGFWVTLAEVHAALAYYYDHKADIDTAIEADMLISDLPHLQDVIRRSVKVLMTPEEIADELPVKYRMVTAVVKQGKIRARRFGSTWLVLRRDAEAKWGKR